MRTKRTNRLQNVYRCLAGLLLGAVALAASAVAQPSTGDVALEKLRPEHPRLLFTTEDQARIEGLARHDTLLAALIADVVKRADLALHEPVVDYVLIGPRLLSRSRACIEKVLALSLAYRLTGRREYLDRAVQELHAAAAFPDWNPSHFLDVAEMTTAFALGYDWLFHALSPEQRTWIRTAIVEKGLKPGLEKYREPAWWVAERPNNWNQVCNGGLALGALALADEEPALAAAILTYARESIPYGMKAYAPEGQYVEGPSYWDYGTTYNALLIAVLESALGTDWGLKASEGFENTGAYRLQTITPTRQYFNYADGRPSAHPSPTMFWLAGAFERPDLAVFHRAWLAERLAGPNAEEESALRGRFMPLEVVWYVPGAEGALPAPPLDAIFRGVGDVAAFRSGWEPEAIYMGFKGGKNDASHAHLDIGSFILEADGVRWAVDLGPDDYNLPGYWDAKEGGQRWQYYRLNSTSHNTLTFGSTLQRAHAESHFTAYSSSPERAHAVADLSEAYDGQAEQVRRGVALLDRSRVLVQDEVVAANEPAPVRWGMVTYAEVQLNGSTAILTHEGRRLRAEILAPKGATFRLDSTDPGDPHQERNEGTVMLATDAVAQPGEPLRLVILLSPEGGRWPELPLPEIVPLDQWDHHPGSFTAH